MARFPSAPTPLLSGAIPTCRCCFPWSSMTRTLAGPPRPPSFANERFAPAGRLRQSATPRMPCWSRSVNAAGWTWVTCPACSIENPPTSSPTSREPFSSIPKPTAGKPKTNTCREMSEPSSPWPRPPPWRINNFCRMSTPSNSFSPRICPLPKSMPVWAAPGFRPRTLASSPGSCSARKASHQSLPPAWPLGGPGRLRCPRQCGEHRRMGH